MPVRDVLRRAVACTFASILLVSPAGASAVSARTVSITLNGSGKALWKLDSSRETSRLALEYHWHGTLPFAVAARVINDPKHRRLSVTSGATLLASWTGSYVTRKNESVTRCRYRGTQVASRISAKLARGRAGNTIELTLHPYLPERGFFADKGRRAVIRCSAGYAQAVPSHFAPSWFFRDNLQDHGRLSFDTAVLVLPGTLLAGGSTTVAFPSEKGRNDSVGLGHLRWNNNGKTAVRVR